MDYKDNFEKLVKIMDELREKCPWDKKQTVQTLRTMTIEETYELADAVTTENWNDIKEELGRYFIAYPFLCPHCIGTKQVWFK